MSLMSQYDKQIYNVSTNYNLILQRRFRSIRRDDILCTRQQRTLEILSQMLFPVCTMSYKRIISSTQLLSDYFPVV